MVCRRLVQVVVIVSIVTLCLATVVQKCNQGADDSVTIDNQVFISGCDKPPCKLLKNSSVNLEFIFTPDYDVSRLLTNVYAWIFAIPLPYLPVDGTTACNNLYLKSTGARATCPIRKGQQYVYKNKLVIHAAYPKAKVVLHWALVDARNNGNVFCFEVPVKIVNETRLA